MKDRHFVERSACERLRSPTLFYSSAGRDIEDPVSLFYPWVEDFWLVDTTYNSGSTIAVPGCERCSSRQHTAAGTTLRKPEPFELTITTESWFCTRTNRSFSLHFVAGRGYDAFRTLFKDTGHSISVFYYRGDSWGNGGSGFQWLRRQRLRNLLEVVAPEGLVVSDGSNAISQLSRFHRSDDNGDVSERAKSFETLDRQFDCVGYAGHRYGPTLIWKLTPLENSSTS